MKILTLISCVTVILTTLEATTVPARVKENEILRPIVEKLHIRSDIQFRYSKTVVESEIKNPSDTDAQEAAFAMVLPEKAFITNFTIETKGTEYVSKVEKKENASKKYKDAVSKGQTAGLVDAREGSVFAIKTNIAAAETLTFTLTYEQLLQRRLSKYEQVINLNPGQLVEDLQIEIYIEESLPLVDVKVPQLKQESTELFENLAENPVAVLNWEDNNSVYIKYKPTIDEQRELDKDGVNGQFIVQYDVDRNNQMSDIQVYDGYLVHFFVPEDLEVLPKHVTFVLDTSGSMSGEKITQLQDAMVTILSDLESKDHFSIIEFNSVIKPWLSLADRRERPLILKNATPIYRANEELVEEAIDYAVGLKASGGTNINDALLEAVEVAEKARTELSDKTTPMIIFLTDGQPTSGMTNQNTIKENVKRSNEAGIPIYALAFGAGADFDLLKGVSQDNNAFARKIFEGSDATIQLENFYAEISSPLLRNVNFEYVGENLKPAENVLPGATFSTGSEFISVVKLAGNKLPDSLLVSGVSLDRNFEDIIRPCILRSDVTAKTSAPTKKLSIIGPCIPPWPPLPPLPPKKRRPANFIERLWAFLTIQKLLDDKADNGDMGVKERNEEAIDIALKYNFVTELTSLVVVKPTENDIAPEKSLAKLTPMQISRSGQSQPNLFLSMPGGKISPEAGKKSVAKRGGKKSALTPKGKKQKKKTKKKKRASKRRNKSRRKGGKKRAKKEGKKKKTRPTPRPGCVPTDCKIELFSKTLLREDSVSITTDTPDLALEGFDNKVESLRVSGNCQWTVYTEKKYSGDGQSFSKGEYKNAINIRTVLRKASSIKNLGCKI